MAKKKITLQSNLLEVLSRHPETHKVISRYGMRCRRCRGAAEETVYHSAVTHGVDPDVMVRELNEAVKKG